jgi:hypothetical protein
LIGLLVLDGSISPKPAGFQSALPTDHRVRADQATGQRAYPTREPQIAGIVGGETRPFGEDEGFALVDLDDRDLHPIEHAERRH